MTSSSNDQAPNRLSLATTEVEHDNKHPRFDYEGTARIDQTKMLHAGHPLGLPSLARLRTEATKHSTGFGEQRPNLNTKAWQHNCWAWPRYWPPTRLIARWKECSHKQASKADDEGIATYRPDKNAAC
jgi:hypothetical protein